MTRHKGSVTISDMFSLLLRSLFILLVATIFQKTDAKAGSIEYSGWESQFVLETSPNVYSQLLPGSYVSLGTFDTSGPFSFNLIGTPSFSTWENISPYYTEYGNTAVFLDGGFGVFTGEATVFGIEGVPLYIVGFDTSSPLTAQRMAIVGGGVGWAGPSDVPPNDVVTLDIGFDSPTVVYGALTTVPGFGGAGSGFDVSLSTIPEPSSLSLIAMGVLSVLIARRYWTSTKTRTPEC